MANERVCQLLPTFITNLLFYIGKQMQIVQINIIYVTKIVIIFIIIIIPSLMALVSLRFYDIA